jgi:hypothetical protein
LCLGALLAVATVIPLGATTAAYADGNGAQTIDCSLIDPALGGTIVFNPSGNLLGNCHEHVQGGGGEGSTGGGATIVDCDEALAPGTVGIQVITPSGGVYTNCHVHVNGS